VAVGTLQSSATVSLALAIAAFGGGVWLLVESVEGLISSLRAWALAAGLSGVLVGALVLGFDIESTAAGVAATLDGLPGTALGTSIGAAIFLVTAGLGIAALVAPFRVRPPVVLLVAAAVATALAIALAADGHLGRLDGAILLASFVPLVAAAVVCRPPAEPPGGARPQRPRRLVLKVTAGLVGLLVGAELLVFGTQRIVSELGLSETVFGLLVVAAAVSFEEVVLEALPAFRGFPELSVGNALGTLVFLLTGSLGVIVLARPIDVPASVTSYHLPALAGAVAFAGALLARGRLGRPEGAALVAAYAAYAMAAVVR
jgi:cation:H+ antiporter